MRRLQVALLRSVDGRAGFLVRQPGTTKEWTKQQRMLSGITMRLIQDGGETFNLLTRRVIDPSAPPVTW